MLHAAKGKARYLLGLPAYLRSPVDLAQARDMVTSALATRETSFLALMERGVFHNPKSAFLPLFQQAGIDLPGLRKLVQDLGLADALDRLYEAGVFLTYEELKGIVPLRRGRLEFRPRYSSFDNPLLQAQYEGKSSGSRSAGSRAFTDLNLLAHEAAEYRLHLEANGIFRSPVAIWGPGPPSFWGLNGLLRFSKVGLIPEKWFSPTVVPTGRGGLGPSFLLQLTRMSGRVTGRPLPWPTYVPPAEVAPVVEWLAAKTAAGALPVIETSASSATRAAHYAAEAGLDIAGTVFRVGGEPFTQAKAEAIRAVGASAVSHYGATELGMAGFGCAFPRTVDDLHVTIDKIHAMNRMKQVGEGPTEVPALVYTTIATSSRKILVNVESGDYGTLVRRNCGCLLGEVGLDLHLEGLHGYDKLTSEGVTFHGSALFDLVEGVLPARFGGRALDYQLVEEEDARALSRLSILIAPRVGEVDEDAVIQTVGSVLGGLGEYGRGRPMAQQWLSAGTLRVVRRNPYDAGGRKILPLHLRQT